MDTQRSQAPPQAPPLDKPKWYEALLIIFLGGIPNPIGRVLRGFFYPFIFNRLERSVRIQPSVELDHAWKMTVGDHVLLSERVYLSCTGSNNQLHLGDRVHLDRDVRLASAGSDTLICLNDRVRLDRGVDVQARTGGRVEIGTGTYIGPYTCITGPGQVKIGNNCMIASQVGIYANNHQFNDRDCLIKEQGLTTEGIVIGDDCWLGTGVKVLDGVTISKGSVIGAGAVVTKDIPPYSVAVGVPARVVGQRGQNSPLEKSALTQAVT